MLNIDDIDGYNPPDPKIASEIGVELMYPTVQGKFFIRAKFAGRANPAFKIAQEAFALTEASLAKTGGNKDTDESMRRHVALWHDTLIVSWNTSIKLKGKKIESTRDNFISLLSSDLYAPVFICLIGDSSKTELFQQEAEKETVKN